jgi:thioesterase domain-containing protein
VILFRASDHRLTSLDDPSLGWGPVCRGGLEVIGLAGGHGDVIHEPGVGTMARELGARLRVLQEADGDDGQSATDNSEAFSGW